jgi:hypothetical protein
LEKNTGRIPIQKAERQRKKIIQDTISSIEQICCDFLKNDNNSLEKLFNGVVLEDQIPFLAKTIKTWLETSYAAKKDGLKKGLFEPDDNTEIKRYKSIIDLLLSVQNASVMIGKKAPLAKYTEPSQILKIYDNFSQNGLTTPAKSQDIIKLINPIPTEFDYENFDEPITEENKNNDTEEKIYSYFSGFSTTSKKYTATYKTGLQCPESLEKPFNNLVLIHEVITFFHTNKEPKHIQAFWARSENQKFINNKNDLKNEHLKNALLIKFFQNKKYVESPPEIKKIYNKEAQFYSSKNYMQLEMALAQNNQELSKYLHKDPKYRPQILNKSQLPPEFKDPSQPKVNEISLSDYKYLTATGIKQLGSFYNAYIMQNIDTIPPDYADFLDQALQNSQQKNPNTKYSITSFKQYPEKAVAEFTQNNGVYANIAQLYLGWGLKAKNELELKLTDIKMLLFPQTGTSGFEDVSALLGFSYYVPNHFAYYLKNKWKVQSVTWVQNTIRGMRRKIDAHLPKYMQIESQTIWMDNLYKKLITITDGDPDEQKVLSRLYKLRILHIFCVRNGPDLSALLSNELLYAYGTLKSKLINYANLLNYPDYISVLSQNEFNTILTLKIAEVQGKLQQIPQQNSSYSNIQTFLHKLQEINKKENREFLYSFLPYIIPGNRFMKTVSQLLSNQIPKYRRLFSVVSALLPSALALHHTNATAQLNAMLKSDTALTKPFKSENRKKKILPSELYFPKYVILRKSDPKSNECIPFNRTKEKTKHTVTVTELFSQNKPIWVGIPLFLESNITNATTTGEIIKSRMLWNRIFPSKKILYALSHGAQVDSMRILPPNKESQKIVVDVTLSCKNRDAFKHRSNIRNKFDSYNIPFPKGTYLGTDWNRLGEFMLACGVDGVPLNLYQTGLMEPLKKIQKRIDFWTHTEIPRLQQKLTRISASDIKLRRIKRQITLLHTKIETLRKESKHYVLQVLAYVSEKTNIKHIAWDGVEGINNSGLQSNLANAVTSMPKSQDQMKTFVELMDDWGLTKKGVQIHTIRPPWSLVCPDEYRKTGKMNRTAQPSPLGYDFVECNGRTYCRHDLSACVGSVTMELLDRSHQL